MRITLSIVLVLLQLILLVPVVFAWELERPADLIMVNERTENSRTDSKASVGLGVEILRYSENYGGFPSYGGDYVDLKISATANTRKIISYGIYSDYYSWHDNLQNEPGGGTLSLGDDDGVRLWMQGVKARFYGGPNSAEYDGVWVSSNGFISFDPDSTPTNPYYSYSIPNSNAPNTFAAPFWRDLKPISGGSITYGKVWHRPGGGPNIECFVISWNNVPDKNDNQQTFQVLIENAPTRSMKHRQSRIWFQYKSITLNDQTTVGIEDQQGGRGTSFNYLSLANEMTLLFTQSSNSAFIGLINIKLSENEASATTEIDRTPSAIRGYNVILEQNLPDEQEQYAIALGGGSTLLVNALELGGKLVLGAGFLLDTVLITVDWARYMARQQALANLLEIDSTHAKARAVDDPDRIFISDALDASFDITAFWIFTDPNNEDHTLTVTAELTYVEYDDYGNVVATTTIPTSADLKFTRDENNDWNTARVISSGSYSRIYLGGTDNEDFYTINVPTGYAIEVWMYPPTDADFDLYLYRPDRTPLDWSENRGLGLEETVSGIASSPSLAGNWFIKMQKYSGQGFYFFSATIYDPSETGGCPFASTWDGNKYVLDNNLLPTSESSGGADVLDYYMLRQTLAQRPDGTYSLVLSEFENEHDFFDRVQLMAVDHSPNVSVAVSPYGEILTYTSPSPPTSAIDDINRNVKSTLSAIDGNYYQGYNGSYITLNFGDLDVSQGTKLVLTADAYKRSIHVQVQDAEGNWNTVTTVTPRISWSTEIVDMSRFLPDVRGNLKVRLYFTANHKLDFVGLDTSPQANIQIHQGQLLTAFHSSKGDVTSFLLYKDQTYAKLMPQQQIELSFTLPQQTTEKRDFIVIAEGHYFTTYKSP